MAAVDEPGAAATADAGAAGESSKPVTLVQQVLAAKGLSAPSAADYALLIDLRERVRTYLDAAAEEWFARYLADNPDIRPSGTGWVDDFDADEVSYNYYAHPDDIDYGNISTVTIPIGDLLSSYGAIRATLKALGAS